MNSLYTNAMRDFIHSRDWPKGLYFEVREAVEPEPHLNLIFFRDNWLTLDVEAQMTVASIVKEVMDALWNMGVPTYVGKMESKEETWQDEWYG